LKTIDLNCDLAEGFPNDEALMKYISSANIACGFHAGDFSLMSKTVSLCKKFDVAVGAHPGFPDKGNFGRTEMNLSNQAVYDLMLYQLGALHAIAKAQGANLRHVKPHGALYNMAAINLKLSNAIADSIFDFDRNLILYGLAGSQLIEAAKAKGIAFKQEAFADRTYQPDGTLTSRSHPNALIENADTAMEQVLHMIKSKTVVASNGASIHMQADTICIHGDGDHAIEFAMALNAKLKSEGIQITFR
jgi:5-oxoprolinase (ATP-hydrolysing) subunit A